MFQKWIKEYVAFEEKLTEVIKKNKGDVKNAYARVSAEFNPQTLTLVNGECVTICAEIDYIIDCFLKEHSKYFYGVCLTKEIHDEFHVKYGTIGFTPEDFYEFYNCKTGRVFDPSFLMPQNIENQERKCLNGL